MSHSGILQGGRVVIIGGGVIGTSIGFHLTDLGYQNVTILERGNLGEGATAAATGGIRQQFNSEINARLVRRSIELYKSFPSRTGEPFAFREHGYLFLIGTGAGLALFEEAVRMQNRLGIPSQVLEPAALENVMPGIRLDGLAGGAYCPADGSGTPQEAVSGYAAAMRRQGGEIRLGTEAVGFSRARSGEPVVLTPSGTIAAELVLIAAGPQTRDVATLAGVTVPVTPHRRQAFAINPLPWLSESLPLTVDLSTGSYIHPERGGRAVIGGNDRCVPAGTDTRIDWGLAESLMESLMHRFPRMRDASISRGWAGLREMTPDDNALVGPLGKPDGFWVAAGFSGHGFMQAPAIGEAVAELLVSGKPGINLDPLRPGRFAEGPVSHEGVVF
jgi:sarcosine oxidase, subunit beta